MKTLFPLTVWLISGVLGATADRLLIPRRRPVFVPAEARPQTCVLPGDSPEISARKQFGTAVDALAAHADPKERDDRFLEFRYAVRSLGAPGLQAVGDYLRSGQDVDLHRPWSINGTYNGLVEPPTLRMTLLDGLRNWPGPDALEIDRDVLHHTTSFGEAVLAVRNLVYQEDSGSEPVNTRGEAVPALRALLDRPILSPGDDLEARFAIDVLRLYHDPDLIPGVERRVESSNDPEIFISYLEIISTLSPEEVRQGAYAHVLRRQVVVDALARSLDAVRDLDFTCAAVQSALVQLFAHRWNDDQRKAFLTGVVDPYTPGDGKEGWVLFADSGERIESVLSEVPGAQEKAKLEVLSALGPAVSTPAMGELVMEARTTIQKSLEEQARWRAEQQ